MFVCRVCVGVFGGVYGGGGCRRGFLHGGVGGLNTSAHATHETDQRIMMMSRSASNVFGWFSVVLKLLLLCHLRRGDGIIAHAFSPLIKTSRRHDVYCRFSPLRCRGLGG